jgi:hypothetical protein
MGKWFAVNKLTLNLDETKIIKFIAPHFLISIGYEDKYIENQYTQNFLAYELIDVLTGKPTSISWSQS